MTLATILVHLDNSERCAARVAVAARLAATHGSHLVGLVPTGMLDGVIPADAIPMGGTDFIAESADYLRRRAETVVHAFRQQIAESSPVPHDVRMVDGESVDATVHHGRASDLVVLGQSDPERPLDTVAHNLPQQVLMQVGRPVLVVPYAGHFTELGCTVLVAWNDSREAAVALRDALPLLDKTTRLTLASFRQAVEPDPESRRQAAAMCQWLARHGVQADFEEHVSGADVADMLLSRASDLGVDLIVMGGYGHARFRELVLGGVTRGILAHMTVPVLMSH